MGRHHHADAVLHADDAITPPSGFPVIPAPRVSPESAPEPRGWRARRVARAEAAADRARSLQIAHAQRRTRQVALASLPVE